MMKRPTPVFERVPARFDLEGYFARYLETVSANWLKLMPAGNPAMLEMLRDRDRLPARNLVPWAGEFVGKYITGAVQCLRLNHDRGLERTVHRVVEELLTLQAEDGYLGPWPKAYRLANRWSDSPKALNWDTWGHYHVMLGLLLWHEDTGDARALAAAGRIGDAICRKYLGKKQPRLVETGSTEMNLAPAHSLALLYRRTRAKRHLQMAEQLVAEFAAKDSEGRFLAGNYLEGTLAGQAFFQLPRPRWESLHPIMALAELYYLTGKQDYREAFTRLWRSMRTGDRHNNGGWSAGEQAQGNPYHYGAIETCCTIAFAAMSVEMLRLTGAPEVADELEMITFNSGLGLHSPSGKWATYNTPMDGTREASHHSIVFQARAGQPDLNCCSVNAARSLGLVSDWALMRDAQGVVINWYGPGKVRAHLAAGGKFGFNMDTDYPLDGRVKLRIKSSTRAEVALKLRIPAWSVKTRVTLNGSPVTGVTAGSYLTLKRKWRDGDKLDLQFDMSLHAWPGARECAGKGSLYRGPILLTWDRRYNTMDPDQVPALDGAALRRVRALLPATWEGWLPPALLLETRAANGTPLRLCDFASAGNGGTPYVSWLPMVNTSRLRASPFTPDPYFLAAATLEYGERLFAQFAEARHGAPADALRLLAELRHRQAALLEASAVARELNGKKPRAESAKRLRAQLANLDTQTPLLDPDLPQILSQLEDDVYARHPHMPRTLTAFACSALQPVVPDIRTVAAPPARLPVSPVRTVTHENFCDIRGFHGGGDGLLYVRAEYAAPEASRGELRYGADGPVRVWVNGKPVGCEPDATNPANPDAYRAAVAWRKGTNRIVFALGTNQGRAWGVFATAVGR